MKNGGKEFGESTVSLSCVVLSLFHSSQNLDIQTVFERRKSISRRIWEDLEQVFNYHVTSLVKLL